MDRDEYRRLSPHLREVFLERGRTLIEPTRKVDRIWFPHDCVVSMVTVLACGASTESAIVGREGLVGFVSSLGDGTGLAHGVVRLAGTASAIERPNFLDLFNSRTGFRDACLRYSGAFLAHVLQTAACNRHHPVEARLARWLLTLSDRVGHDGLPVTHEFSAAMLGCDRSTVSIAARSLQSRGLIAQGRGIIRIRRRAGLEALSCECYATVRERLRHILRSSENACVEGMPNGWQPNRPRAHDAVCSLP